MMALKLNKGAHKIVFRYRNKAFTTGLIISVVCLIVFLGFVFSPKFIPVINRKLKKNQA